MIKNDSSKRPAYRTGPPLGSKLCPDDVRMIDHEPRILDRRLGDALGIARDEVLQHLIRCNRRGLAKHDRLALHKRSPTLMTVKGRPPSQYWLTERQCLAICSYFEGITADQARMLIISVFAYYREDLQQLEAAGGVEAVRANSRKLEKALARISALEQKMENIDKQNLCSVSGARYPSQTAKADCKNTAGLLSSAGQIAAYLGMPPKSVARLAKSSGMPVFKLGKTICANKEAIDNWLKASEQLWIGAPHGKQ